MSAAVLSMSACLFDANYRVGGTVTGLRGTGLVLQNSSGKYLDVTATGSFTFPSGLANHATYSVTVRTQPSNPAQTCTVVNAAGSIDKADVTNVIVTCTQAGRFAYVANENSNSISAYSIDSGTGLLSPLLNSPFATPGSEPVALAVDPNGAFMYVAQYTSNDVSVYAIEDTTGQLTPSGVAFAVGNAPSAVAIDPTNRFLYVANQSDGTVSAFTLAAGNGFPTAITGSPFVIDSDLTSLKVSPNGTTLYASSGAEGRVSALAIDQISGALTLISGSPFGAGAGALSLAIDPTNAFLYVANANADSIAEFSIAASTGGLAGTSGSPLATTSSVQFLAADPNGKFVYVANATSNNEVASYGITPAGGTLTVIAATSAGSVPVALAVDPASTYLYVANNESADVSVFALDAAGSLTAVTGSPFAAADGPRSIVID